MIEYLDAATKATLHQIFYGFVIVFVVALFMNSIGGKLRSQLAGRLLPGKDSRSGGDSVQHRRVGRRSGVYIRA